MQALSLEQLLRFISESAWVRTMGKPNRQGGSIIWFKVKRKLTEVKNFESKQISDFEF